MKRFLFPFVLALFLFPLTGESGTANLPSTKVLLITTDQAPVAGTNEVQTITFGSGQVSGNFTLRFNNRTTASIAWSATNNTLRDNIDLALESLGNIGTSGVTTAVGSMTAGIGTITVTFVGNNRLMDVPQMTVPSKTTSGAIAVTTTTPGVIADGRSAPANSLLWASNIGLYVNIGAPPSPEWVLLIASP